MLAFAGGRIQLWDAAGGVRTATLEGTPGGGLASAFHPAGTLLVSRGWDGRLRFRDPHFGRPILDLPGDNNGVFTRDGRTIIGREDKLSVYEIAPALEYRTLVRGSASRWAAGSRSTRTDGCWR